MGVLSIYHETTCPGAPDSVQAFDRRPYFREVEGALIVELDLLALAGKTVSLAITAPAGGLPDILVLNATVEVGPVS